MAQYYKLMPISLLCFTSHILNDCFSCYILMK